MPKKSKKLTYRQKASALRSVGFQPSLGKRGVGKSSVNSLRSKKGAVTKAWNKYGQYLDGKKSVWKFVGSTKEQSKRFGVKSVRTPKGFFVRVPKGISKKRYRVSFEGDRMHVDLLGAGSKRIRGDTIITLDAIQVARNCEGYVKKELERINPNGQKENTQVRIMVNGWDGKNTKDFKQMAQYMDGLLNGEFLPKGYSAEDFEDTFHLKVIE